MAEFQAFRGSWP